MPSAIIERPATFNRYRTRSSTDLVSVAAPVFELVLRLRAGLLSASSELRHTVEEMLGQMEQRGAALKYDEKQVQDTKFALAAFVDEAVLTDTNILLREEWGKHPLQLSYFGEHLAGIKFFERLDKLLKEPETNADVIEVYYLCLLLGFKGKYKKYLEEQLQGVITNTAEHLRRAHRLHEGELSPHWKATDQPEPPRDQSLPRWLQISSAGAIGLVILSFIILQLLLKSYVSDTINKLLR